ncbi:radical SAM protein [Streptomyces sp. NPDC085929]|uniref:radical SAM protein n=1 Tax=Streptomyces sp. NPDC085929 TaxID=3365739 RepID=UPI0037CF2562
MENSIHRWAEPHALVVEPKILTILGTYKCTAACENCCFGSNPFLTKRLTLEDIIAFIDEGSRGGECEMVVFSGGECFLLRNDLVAAISHATDLGLATRVVTNGYWAKRMDHGRRRLSALKEAGLRELNVSTGDYHQQFVDEDTVINAAYLGVEQELKTLIIVELQKERQVTAAHLAAIPRVLGLLRHNPPVRIIESPWIPMDYRQAILQDEGRLINRENVHLRKGCDSIFNTIVVTPDQNVGFCCGLGRERIPELNTSWVRGSLDGTLQGAARDFMKIWIYVDGPEKILAWAAEKDDRITWENRYAHRCHACLALFSDPLVRETIRRHYRERLDDVLMRYVTRLRTQQENDHAFADLP